MTLDEAIKHAEEVMVENLEKTKGRNASDPIAINCFECAEEHRQLAKWLKGYKRMLEQEPCNDCVSRQAVLDMWRQEICCDRTCHARDEGWCTETFCDFKLFEYQINHMPPVTPQSNIGHCKDCKYFEHDSVAKVDEIPLIVAHEICKRWGDGCKTKEDGYCFLYEPQEGSEG